MAGDYVRDPEFEHFCNLAIKNTREKFVAVQGQMGLLERCKFKPAMPLMVRMIGGELKAIYRDNAVIRDQGVVVWGHIIQANTDLFDPKNYDNLPAGAIYSCDPYYDSRLDQLAEIAGILFATKGKRGVSPELRKLSRIISDERTMRMKISVPESLTDGRKVYYTSIMVHRKQLPVPFLVCSAFPLIVAPKHTTATMILPSQYWSEEMEEYWMIHYDQMFE